MKAQQTRSGQLVKDSLEKDSLVERSRARVVREYPPAKLGIDSFGIESLEGRLFLSASDLDTTFGLGGRALTAAPGGSDFSAVTAAPGGKYVIAGSRNYNGNINFLVARYNANGSPDTSFDGIGRVYTDFGGMDIATSVAALPSGKILVSGYGADTNGQHPLFCIARYNSNGKLDPAFGGGDGKVTTDFNGRSAFTGGMKVLSSGKFLVAGTCDGFTLARYNADGTLDKTFGGGDGWVNATFAGLSAIAYGVATNSAGQIFVSGATWVQGGNEDFAVARITAGGVVDTSFGGGKGWVRTDLASSSNPGSSEEASAIAITSGGKVLVGGYTTRTDGRPNRFALVQYNSNGTLDTGFGSGTGKVLINLNPDPLSNTRIATATNLNYNGTGLTVTSSGKIVVAGYSNGETKDQWGYTVARTEGMGVARCNANGALDSSFGVDGKKPLPTMDWTSAVFVDSAGKIVVAGGFANKAALVRLGTATITTASISGTFFNDKNGDGKLQLTEPLMADWQAYVDLNHNGVYDYYEPTAFTNASGTYTIKGLAAGTYRVYEVRKSGWTRTTPAGTWPLGYYNVTLAVGQAISGKIFGNRIDEP